MVKVTLIILLGFFHFALPQRRIYNGDEAKQKQFPYMAIIQGPLSCGGALLNKRYVLTAAHCLMDTLKNEKVTVILGAHNYYNNGEEGRLRLRSEKYWIHENFTYPAAVNDLGIIELPQDVSFSESIRPIKVSTKKIIDTDKELTVVLSGWGYKKGGYTPAVNLQTAKLRLISYEKCLKYQGYYVEKITKDHICAMGSKNQDGSTSMACDGDSGSPLVLADTQTLVGITSFIKDAENGTFKGNDCRTEVAPVVFAKVASYLNWISEKTGMKFE